MTLESLFYQYYPALVVGGLVGITGVLLLEATVWARRNKDS
jgi:hypothetical protein